MTAQPLEKPATSRAASKPAGRANRPSPGDDWSQWPIYNAATLGFRNYWYPVVWEREVTEKPLPVTLLGEKIALVRKGDTVYALHDRCPHRGVPLSCARKQEFPGTVTCPYHGWTFDVTNGKLVAVITDGPDSPICGRVSVKTYPTAQRLGLVWVYVGDGDPHPVEQDIPEELINNDHVMGGKYDIRDGNWRFAAENGFDEGHAKYLHNTALWRLFKVMPTWNKTRVEEHGPWLIRVQEELHWEAYFPGLGTWTNKRWWKQRPLPDAPGKGKRVNPVIAAMNLPGFVSIRLPGLLRVAYPEFIHYEWYVPVDADHVRYVQMMVRFEDGPKGLLFKAKYLAAIRWLFHGQFTAQDAWMVDVMDAPPEKLYRPDLSITGWRRMVEKAAPTPQPYKAPSNG